MEGISAGGEDPIGPAVRELRDASPTLRAWVQRMQSIITREALLAAAETHNNQLNEETTP